VKYPTLDEMRAAWDALTDSQQSWVKDKCRVERMTRWAVMNEWDVPNV